MKRIIFAVIGSLLSISCYGQGEDPVLLGFVTVGKTTIDEFESKIPSRCGMKKEYLKNMNGDVLTTEEFQYRISKNCFDLLGSPKIYASTKNKRIQFVKFQFWGTTEYQNYEKIVYSKYGQPSTDFGGMKIFKKGDTSVSLTQGSHTFDLSYRFAGDLGKYDQNYNIRKKHTENMM